MKILIEEILNQENCNEEAIGYAFAPMIIGDGRFNTITVCILGLSEEAD